MKPSCENLTSAIQELKILRQRVGFAINSLNPRDGQVVKDESNKILEPYLFRSLFKKETYEYLIKVLRSETELKARTARIETIGKTGEQILTELMQVELDSKKIIFWGNSKFMFLSPEFQPVKAGVIISTVRLQVRALFSDENSHTYAEILTRAAELGLDFLPHEAAADILSTEKTLPRMGEWYIVVSAPIVGRFRDPLVFSTQYHLDTGLVLSSDRTSPDLEWDANGEFVFGLRKLED
jgi:hypothetical protein